jgi:hypothetical protein
MHSEFRKLSEDLEPTLEAMSVILSFESCER